LGIDIHQAMRSESASVPPFARLSPRTPAITKPERSETGVWIGMFAIVMSFAAFTSAMIVRQGVSSDWRRFELPRLLYLNTLTLIASSLTLVRARARLTTVAKRLPTMAADARRRFFEGMNWLYVTFGLGTVFLVGQVLVWRLLVAQGLFLSTNPSSSFFYVFTAMHALHLFGGILALAYIIHKLARTRGTAATTGLPAVCLYWHFMDGLWLYLLILLIVRT
jgi:cytochrome c oxidase subunit 3